MKRHIPGLHSRPVEEGPLEGLLPVRVEGASFSWRPQKPFLALQLVVVEPKAFANQSLLTEDQVDDKALVNLRGVIRTTHITQNGRTFQNLEAFAPEVAWDELSCAEVGMRSRNDL